MVGLKFGRAIGCENDRPSQASPNDARHERFPSQPSLAVRWLFATRKQVPDCETRILACTVSMSRGANL